MYQIIYIDIDEEITSVIDKLRKSKTAELFLAIPQRSLIIQSVVSLKLLYREAEKLNKHIVIVTQDPREQKAAEKAGIETRESLEGIDTKGEMRESVVPEIQDNESFAEKVRTVRKIKQRKSTEEIGSDDFYDIHKHSKISENIPEPSLNKTNHSDMTPKRAMSEIYQGKKNNPEPQRVILGKTAEPRREIFVGSPKFDSSQATEKAEKLENFFQKEVPAFKKKPVTVKEPRHTIPVPRAIKKTIYILLVACFVLILGIGAYLFIPKAEVTIKTKNQIIEKDLDLRGDIKADKIDDGNLIIPAQIQEKEDTFTFNYPVAGKGSVSGQKAKGRVVIYNEYSAETQPLVATTRLQTEDKKIFRLVKGVVVPGTTQVDGKTQPGAIEAEVVADEPGENYNIDPATFIIPGFAGSPKFSKFYAKSSEKMTGGSSQGQNLGLNQITKTDVANAKEKSESQAEDKIMEGLKSGLSQGTLYFDSASEKEILESTSISKVGEAVSELQYRVRIKIRAITFLESDVKKLFEEYFRQKNNLANNFQIEVEYGAVSGDLASETASIKAHGKLSINSEVDIAKLKTDLAGKESAEIGEVIKKYPQISEAEINIKPYGIFTRIPQLQRRIEVRIVQ